MARLKKVIKHGGVVFRRQKRRLEGRKVRQNDPVPRRHHEVFAFDVTVHDAFAVALIQRAQELWEGNKNKDKHKRRHMWVCARLGLHTARGAPTW